jgi:hypothetical protein
LRAKNEVGKMTTSVAYSCANPGKQAKFIGEQEEMPRPVLFKNGLHANKILTEVLNGGFVHLE